MHVLFAQLLVLPHIYSHRAFPVVGAELVERDLGRIGWVLRFGLPPSPVLRALDYLPSDGRAIGTGRR